MTDEKREQTRDLLVQDLKHYRHPKERNLLRTLESRFTSGNDVPVTRAMITREEYEQLRSLLADREGFVWVPRDASEAMIEAGMNAWHERDPDNHFAIWTGDVEAMWKAMCAAATKEGQ
jgi:hypothetical protein